MSRPAPALRGLADPPMRVRALVARDPAGGLPGLFRGREVSYSYNTRVAIRQACDVLDLKPGDGVLAPGYNCGSDLDPLHDAGLAVTLYPVDRQARIDPDEIARRIDGRTRAVYLTHYFGFLQPETAAVRALCDRHGLRLIEDCALSLLSGAHPAEGRAGDVAVFCFYKFFPVLAGGALVVNRPVPRTPSFTGTGHRRPLLRETVRAAAQMALGADGLAALRRLRRGGAGGEPPAPPPGGALPDMPSHYYFDRRLRDAPISGLAARQIRSFDVAAAIGRRRANYAQLLDLLRDLPGATPLFGTLPDDACPLTMPVLTGDPGRVVAGLRAEGVPAVAWWSGYSRNLDHSGVPDACFLKDRIVALPMHQYLGAAQMTAIAGALARQLRQA